MKKVNHSIYLFLIDVTLLWILTRLFWLKKTIKYSSYELLFN